MANRTTAAKQIPRRSLAEFQTDPLPAVQLPGGKRHTRMPWEQAARKLAPLIERLKARCDATGHPIARVILTHEAGREGFGWRDF
jgi:hypothetical protein